MFHQHIEYAPLKERCDVGSQPVPGLRDSYRNGAHELFSILKGGRDERRTTTQDDPRLCRG